MGVYDSINVKIRGQIKPVGLGKVVEAELNVIATKYDLDIEHCPED